MGKGIVHRAPRWAALSLLALGIATASGCYDHRQLAARNLYDRRCSRCHGLSNTGPTPVSGLPYQPADLRHLYERYGTPLDHDRLAAYIDGRHMLEGERSQDMPVWGRELYANLSDEADDEAIEDMRAGAIDLLIEYLQEIQASPRDD